MLLEKQASLFKYLRRIVVFTMMPMIASVATRSVSGASNAQAVSTLVQRAIDLGDVAPSQPMTVTVYLGLHNQAGFDQALQDIYNPQSARYQKWMSDSDLAPYSPTVQELTAVAQELKAHGLTILAADDHNQWVRVQGTAASVQSAFQTQIHNLNLKGTSVYAHVTPAKLTGTAGDLVSNIVGLDQRIVTPRLTRVKNPQTGKPIAPIALSNVTSASLGNYLTNVCLQPPATLSYTTPGAALPTAKYSGFVYNPVDSLGNSITCGFTAAQLQAHYGLTPAYSKGLDGTGQTIVLLEAYGYPTIQADANAFSTLMGLPQLTSKNFQIVYPAGTPNPTLGTLTGWDVEIALDVQWAHSMAPNAKIVVVVSYGQDSEDFQFAMNYIINKNLGTVVSDSWEEDLDILSGPAEQDSYTTVLKKAAAKGISFQFSSGDGGDGGLGTPIGAAGVPSNNPWATSVGGTSIVNNPNGTGFWETGWGTTLIDLASNGVIDPPAPYGGFGFYGGAGGGESVYFAKPAWQKSLPGTGRQTPDVSALADPFTGVPLVVTENGKQYLLLGIGGTSLASPVFTGIYALATQKAGHPLGVAGVVAPTLPPGAFVDILPLTSTNDVHGTITDSAGTSNYSAATLFSGLTYTSTGFLSADYPIIPGPTGVAYAISFGLDSSLTVTPGWDSVTGFGVPNGLTFINAFACK